MTIYMRKQFIIITIISWLIFTITEKSNAQNKPPRFHAIVLYENRGWHIEYSKVAKVWLDKLALDSNFAITYIQNTDPIDEAYLSKFRLFIQLDYAPYAWKDEAMKGILQLRRS